MKTCYRCKINKPLTEFNKNGAKKDGLNGFCRVCSNKNSKKHYQLNTEKHKKNVYKNKKIYITELRRLINIVKERGCALCEEKEPCCLEFHHIHKNEKEEEISKLIASSKTRKLNIELNKCAIVCANCHRKIHAGLLPNPIDKQLQNINLPKISIENGVLVNPDKYFF